LWRIEQGAYPQACRILLIVTLCLDCQLADPLAHALEYAVADSSDMGLKGASLRRISEEGHSRSVHPATLHSEDDETAVNHESHVSNWPFQEHAIKIGDRDQQAERLLHGYGPMRIPPVQISNVVIEESHVFPAATVVLRLFVSAPRPEVSAIAARAAPVKRSSKGPSTAEKAQASRTITIPLFSDAPQWMKIVTLLIVLFLLLDSTLHGAKIILEALTWVLAVLMRDWTEFSEALRKLLELVR
jgi:hypothetical protein